MQTLLSLIEQYLETCEYERKLSPDTIKAYRIDLRQFSEFVGQDWKNRDMLTRYIKYLNQHFAPRSVKRKVASIRAFYHELDLQGLLEPNPFDRLHIRIHSPQQLPRIIPKQTIHDLLQNAYEAYAPGCRETLRDIVVLELLFSTGLRVSELCALSKDTFSLNDEGLRLLINGKGRKERIIQIITPELLRLLHVYCSEYSKEIEKQGSILFNRRGSPLSPQSVRRIINKYMNRIGTTGHVTPHMFRHTFATSLLESGMDIRYIQSLLGHPNAKIMFYNSEFSSELPRDLDQDVICRNSISLLKMLGDKSAVRMAFSQLAPIVPFQELTYGKNFDLSALFPNFSKLVFQESRSSGGYGTHITEKNDINRLESFVGKPFMVSPYFEQSVSANIHMVIGEETLLYFPGSMQIMRELDGKLLYLGADYITFRTLPPLQKEKLRKFSNSLGSALQGMGYRGVVGFDFLITKDEVMFVEVNARFQASTPLLNKALKESGLPTLQDMQLAAFSGGKLPSQERLDALSVPYSMICYLEGTWDKPYDFLSGSGRIREIADVHFDGFSPQKNVQKNAYLFKVIFNTNCSSINPDCTINLYENLLDVKDEFYNAIVNREKLEVKISLLNQGVRISKRAKEQIQADGKIRSAVFSAVDLTIFDSLQVNCPKALKFSEFTPWEIDINDRRTLTLFFHRFPISDVTLDMEDIYCNNLIKPGVKFSDVCFWATDRLRVHHNLSCCMKDQGVGCRFCEVAPSDNQISIGDILKVVDFYLERADTFRHFLIGGGSEPREIEYKNILRIVNHIRQKSAKDIYVMSLPPKDLHVLAEYYAAGVTEIGFNMELFNPEAALRYMPGKGKISRQEYLAALKEAVKYWGNTGNVRSLMIVGLEEENSLLQGIRQLCEIGVMPILSVFRPIPGTDTQHVVPPSNRFLRDIYQKSATICREFGLHLGPKCVACQNNTLSLPF